jgi:hypothetical protein
LPYTRSELMYLSVYSYDDEADRYFSGSNGTYSKSVAYNISVTLHLVYTVLLGSTDFFTLDDHRQVRDILYYHNPINCHNLKLVEPFLLEF